MIASLIVDWLNENEFRGYPLRENTARSIGTTGLILDPVVLDANLVYTSQPLPATVKLVSLTVAGVAVTFQITDQPAFLIPDRTTAEYPVYLRNSEGSLLVIGEAVKIIPNGIYLFANTAFEDCVASEFRGDWLGCTSLNFPGKPPMVGTSNWIEGYQFDIKIKGSTIHLGANSNYGIPLSCEKFFEDIVDDDCDELVSFINGAATVTNPDIMRFIAGPSVAIFDDPPNHRIYIGLTFDENDVCTTAVTNPETIV